MPPPIDPEPTFEAFEWAETFSTHLRSLGAPNTDGDLFELGRQLYRDYKEVDPVEVAETVWTNWPPPGGTAHSS